MQDYPPYEGMAVEVRPGAADTGGRPDGERPAWLDAHMSGYQKQRQGAYDRVNRLKEEYPSAGGLDPVGSRVFEDAKAEAGLVRAEAGVSRARGEQLDWIRSLIRRGGVARFGYRNPVDMTAALLDIHRETAKDLVYLAERVDGLTIGRIRQGRISYTRVLEETRLREAGATCEQIEQSRRFDLGRVRRFWQKLKKMTRSDEKKIFESQYISFQPSLDGTHYRVAGRLGGYEGEICRKALQQRSERIIPMAEQERDQDRPDPGWRRALALTTLCQDELDQTSRPPNSGASADANDEENARWNPLDAADHADETDETIRQDGYEYANPIATTRPAETPEPARNHREPLLMVVADQTLAEASDYEQGVNILAGPRVGPDTIDLIRCTGRTEHVTITEHDSTGRGAHRQIRPGLRRAVLARDDGCVIDGCQNTYRLQVHHITPRSQGGVNQPHNLAALCWYHHHVAVHRHGLQLDPRSPPHRRRLSPPPRPTKRYYPPPRILDLIYKTA